MKNPAQIPSIFPGNFPCLARICLALASLTPVAKAAILQASDGAPKKYFGVDASRSGSNALVGDFEVNAPVGAAYFFRGLDSANGPLTENVRLRASRAETSRYFGSTVSLQGSTGLIGDFFAEVNGLNQGAAYVYRHLDTATGTNAENVRLLASDGQADTYFGSAVSLSGSMGLVGATQYLSVSEEAYLYRHLDTATGTIFESARLVPSRRKTNAEFGNAVCLEGNTALVGADGAGPGAPGIVYLYRHLDTATGTVSEDAQLMANYGYSFGNAVSLSGTMAVISDIDYSVYSGTAYVFRNLDTVTGTVTESARLAHRGRSGTYEYFGNAVSLSGTTALVGASVITIKTLEDSGVVYLFRDLDRASETVTEDLLLYPSGGQGYFFGSSVSLDGDVFVIGADGANEARGQAYSGNVSSLTTLDTGHVSQSAAGISFISYEDWIVGKNTDANQLALFFGDTADVRETGKAVYIGQNAGADDNQLTLRGALITNSIYVGSTAGNKNNRLQLEDLATLSTRAIRLAPANQVAIHGNLTSRGLLDYFGSNKLQVWVGGTWQTITASNAGNLIALRYASGYTIVQPKP